jgi:membrane protein DedA with SNARE-associated domain
VPTGLLAHFGLLAVFCCVALEAAGVPLPGETVLVLAAGYAGHTGHFSLLALILVAVGAAMIGDNLGYAIGRYGGWPVLRRFGRFLHVHDSDLKVGRLLFERYGGHVVFLGRFVSILRTYAAFLAGTNHMRWRRFLVWNGAGGTIWAVAWTTTAYLLGARLSQVSGVVQWVVLGAAGLLAVVAMVLIRRRWVRLRVAAEAAYPEPLR